ncbi:MAG: hypothetical protein ACOYXT_25000 [Bacteroidota bacterium]
MMNIQKYQTLFARLVIASLVALSLMQCTDDELAKPENQTAVPAEANSTSDESADVASITLAGIHTVVSDSTACSSCTFIVPADARVIDGNEFEFQPGSVICITRENKHQKIEFVNIVGTPENPIIITTCE